MHTQSVSTAHCAAPHSTHHSAQVIRAYRGDLESPGGDARQAGWQLRAGRCHLSSCPRAHLHKEPVQLVGVGSGGGPVTPFRSHYGLHAAPQTARSGPVHASLQLLARVAPHRRPDLAVQLFIGVALSVSECSPPLCHELLGGISDRRGDRVPHPDTSLREQVVQYGSCHGE